MASHLHMKAARSCSDVNCTWLKKRVEDQHPSPSAWLSPKTIAQLLDIAPISLRVYGHYITLLHGYSWGGGNFLSPFSSFSLTTGRKKKDLPFSGQEGDFCYARAITAYELVPHQRPEQDEQRGWELAGKILGPL
jgi:hypothetical protein